MDTRLTDVAQELLARGAATDAALRAGDEVVSYGELGRRISERRRALALPDRSVVVLTGDPSVEWVVTYLALLAGSQVPLLAGDHAAELAEFWMPSATVTVAGDAVDVVRHRPSEAGSQPELHPDLALLLSTSGSTGSPKLVRLSHENLVSNATSIGSYLDLSPRDCGITSLPLHYCYGLSVLHSHLVAGASIVLTSASVVDPCFREAMVTHEVTNVAGVPHTFQLLDHAGADRLHVPSLRFVTQAGGKLAPEAVERWLGRTEGWGVDFFVMYGQTEATARMAYLRPELARRRPGAIGQPIDGGQFSLDRTLGELDDVGELVYRGPNVMLGYATTRADLALGRTIHELRTGDLARFHADDGLYEIVGRRSRFVKPFGLRIDLDVVERQLRATGVTDVAVSGDDDGLIVLAPGADGALVRADAALRTGLPPTSIEVDTDTPIPYTATGKVSHGAITRNALVSPTAAADHDTTPNTVTAVYAAVLGRSDVGPDDSFVSLGGDSLGYIECSIRLEAVLGQLPADWHLRPISTLEPRRRRRFVSLVDTTVPLRVIGIFAVVATHMHLRFVPGGAHLMLAVVGYNLSRFLLPIDDTRARVTAGLRTAARVAVPTVLWVAAGLAVGASYGIGTLLLVNNYVGPASHADDHWHFWFIEVFVQSILLITALLAIPRVRSWERGFPYLFPLVLLGVALVARMDWSHMGSWYNVRFRTHGVLWFLLLGWLVHRSDTLSKRLLTAAVVILTVRGFFEYPPREQFITVGILALLFWREVPVPRLFVRPLATIASATMWIYITHFAIWPPLVDILGTERAYVPTILAGVAIWAVAERATLALTAKLRRRDVARARQVVRIP